jgi:hypothetical protein
MFVTFDSQEKTAKKNREQVKNQLLALDTGLGTYIYQGVEKITSCVTVYEQKKTIATVKPEHQSEFDLLQQQIDLLKQQQEQFLEYTEQVTICAKATKMPKGLNDLLK